MARNIAIRMLRGLLSNIPSLGLGEPYFASDKNRVYIGNGSSNIPVTTPVYNISGVIQAGHLVLGQVTTVSKTVPIVVTLSGNAVFSSASSYAILAQSNAGHITTTYISGSSFSFVTGAIGDVINFVCVGT